jgi:hypothetical protein
MEVTANVIQSVSISTPDTVIRLGESITFTATPTNGGTPSYQWKKNGVNVGTNSDTYNVTPANGDVITCVMTSSIECVTTPTATSNSITMTVLNAVDPGTLSDTYSTPNSNHFYPDIILDYGASANGLKNVPYDAFTDTPNWFTIIKYSDMSTLASTGWVGTANYGGPWGAPPFSNAPSGTFSFTKSSDSRFYILRVQTVTGPTVSDAWEVDLPS